MKITKQTRKGFTLVELLVVMAIIAVLASIATPLVISRLKDADKTKATVNLKQIHLAVIEFKQAYGVLPGELASDKLPGAPGFGSSNEICRMFLIGLPSVRSEVNFFAPCSFTSNPDGEIGEAADDFDKAVEGGEGGFGYFDVPSARGAAPLFFAPLLAADGTQLDIEAYNGYAVTLDRDGTVTTTIMSAEGELLNSDEENLLSADNPAFGDDGEEPLLPEGLGGGDA